MKLPEDFGERADYLWMRRPDEPEERAEPATPYNESANGGRWWENNNKAEGENNERDSRRRPQGCTN